MLVRRLVLLSAGTALAAGALLPIARPGLAAQPAATPFLVKPYLQLGDAPTLRPREQVVVMWQAPDSGGTARWAVEARRGEKSDWEPAEAPRNERVAVTGLEPFRNYRATVADLTPGAEFEYRVLRDGATVFQATGRARRPAGQAHRFALFGDCGANTPAQKRIAWQTWQAKPDYVFITGDIVYGRGRISEYWQKYFPIYNADQASPDTGAPLIRSTLFLASPGNHDIATRDLGQTPDLLAYFLFWAQPLNGPLAMVGAPYTPTLQGPEASQQAFLAAAGSAYPRMANFSVDYGDAHWTVLDGNPYVDWTAPELQRWVERDLAAARGARWRFVGFHQPGFNSSKAHFNEQRMRVLSPLFEKGGVDVVFAGHVHNYQRSFPLRFVPKPQADGKAFGPGGQVAGDWTLDRRYDGKTQTRPDGVIYIVSGSGGNTLYNPEQQDDPASWQAFTDKFISKVHTVTLVDVDPARLTVRQVDVDGKELDRFALTR